MHVTGKRDILPEVIHYSEYSTRLGFNCYMVAREHQDAGEGCVSPVTKNVWPRYNSLIRILNRGWGVGGSERHNAVGAYASLATETLAKGRH